MKRGRKLEIEKPFERDIYYPNAMGRYPDTEWEVFHLDGGGNCRDLRGLLIMPFHERVRLSRQAVDRFLRKRGQELFTMVPSVVPCRVGP